MLISIPVTSFDAERQSTADTTHFPAFFKLPTLTIILCLFVIYNGNTQIINTVAGNGKTSSYSKVISINMRLAPYTLSVYPNPVEEVLYGKIGGAKNSEAEVQLTDMQGKVLKQIKVALANGSTNFSINMKAFSKGNYLMRLRGSNDTIKQVIKQ